MVTKLYKQLLVYSWESAAKRSLRRKFRLYGPYKKLYRWGKFKYLKDHITVFKPLKQRINTEWYKYFTLVRQEENPLYLPEDIWHLYIEPALNNKSYNKAFNDKNLLNLAQYADLFPKVILHIIEGICYSADYCRLSFSDATQLLPHDRPFVAKNSIDSGGGKGVRFYDPTMNKITIDDIIKTHGNNVVLQEEEKQHPWFERFNKDSINTIRVTTYRSIRDEKVNVLQMLFRIGKKGSKVDNQSSGGIACGIDDSGKLNTWGCDKLSNKFHEINGIQLSELNIIPDIELVKSTCIEIAKKRFYERVLVFDTWRDQTNKIRLTEINNVNIGIEDLQKNNGPLLGAYTEEVVNWCASKPRSFSFDFLL